MTTSLFDAASEQRTFAPLGEIERMWLRLLTRVEAGYTCERDEAAMEAEDYWEQAEEACSIDPIG